MTTIKKKKVSADPSSADKNDIPKELPEGVKINENGDEVRERVEDKIIHLFKMTAEKMDHLMTMEQWKLMKDGHEKESKKDLNIDDIDVSEL